MPTPRTPRLRHRLHLRLAGAALVLLAAACEGGDPTQIDDDTQTGATGSGVEQTEPAGGGDAGGG